MKLAAFLLAIPAMAQIQATCPAPGTQATIQWSDAAHPSVYIRIESNADGKNQPHPFPGPQMQQQGPLSSGTATFATIPGPWLAYLLQESPYWQSPAKTFTCDAAVTPPPNPPTETVLPRLVISVQTLDQQPNRTWRIHGDPPLTSLFLLISVNGLIAAEDEYSVEFAHGPVSISGKPVIITANKPWSGKVEARWWFNYTGQ